MFSLLRDKISVHIIQSFVLSVFVLVSFYSLYHKLDNCPAYYMKFPIKSYIVYSMVRTRLVRTPSGSGETYLISVSTYYP